MADNIARSQRITPQPEIPNHRRRLHRFTRKTVKSLSTGASLGPGARGSRKWLPDSMRMCRT